MSEDQSKLASRVTELELSMMHLQKDYDSLNEVVLDHANQIEKMTLMIQQLNLRLQSSSEPAEERKAEDEVPPHY